MAYEWMSPAIPLTGLMTNVGLQMILAHSTHQVGKAIVTGCATGFCVTLSLLVIERVDVPLGTAIVATYLALAFCFWTFINLNITSLRVRIVREVLSAGGSLSYRSLAERYSDEEFLHRRLERLLKLNQVSLTRERWYVKSWTMVLLARTLHEARSVILGSSK